MTVGQQADFAFVAAVLLYLVLGGLLLWKGWPIRAGIGMTAASMIPLTWQLNFTDSDAKGFAILLIMMLPPALGVTIAGLIWWIYRRFVPTG